MKGPARTSPLLVLGFLSLGEHKRVLWREVIKPMKFNVTHQSYSSISSYEGKSSGSKVLGGTLLEK